jgi:hypothetical protein
VEENSKTVRSGSAPVLDEEYGATITHKEVLETLDGNVGKERLTSNIRPGS